VFGGGGVGVPSGSGWRSIEKSDSRLAKNGSSSARRGGGRGVSFIVGTDGGALS
jgi:hypothetical protein